MTLKEAYKQWSQQKDNYLLFVKTKTLFSKVWSNLPFHLECSEYNETKLAQELFLSKEQYENKVKAVSVMVHVLKFDLGDKLKFDHQSIIKLYTNYQNQSESIQKKEVMKENKQPLVYKDKPLIPQEIPVLKKKDIKRQLKPVYQIDNDGNVVKKWDNVKLAAETLNLKLTSLYKAISVGMRFHSYYWSRTPELIDTNPQVKEQPKKKVITNTDNLISQLKVLVNTLRKNGINITVTINI